MITEEYLLNAEALLKASSPGDWQYVLGREGPAPRIDIYTGPTINKEEIAELQKKFIAAGKALGRPVVPSAPTDFVKQGSHQCVLHGHVIQPAWFEQNPNSENDIKFVVECKNKLIPEMISEIRRLNEEINKLKGS